MSKAMGMILRRMSEARGSQTEKARDAAHGEGSAGGALNGGHNPAVWSRVRRYFPRWLLAARSVCRVAERQRGP